MMKQLKLPHIQPGIQSRRVPSTEEEVQASVMQALHLLGYTILQTSVRYRWTPCVHCGRRTRPEGGYRATPGVPDLLVTRRGWGNRWIGIEIKGTTTRLSPAQKELVE